MIHPDDWAVILRWPRLTSLLEYGVAIIVIWLAAVAVIGLAGALFRVKLSVGRQRQIIFGALAIIALVFIFAAFSGRAWQAACWRVGPDGVPPPSRSACESLPPQGNEGYY